MSWINASILLLLCAGHAELHVALVNRVYARRMRCGALRRFRHVHDVMVPLFPVVVLWFVGLRGPGLLVGGDWADVPLAWMIVLGMCALGAGGLFFSAARWQFRRSYRSGGIPSLLRSNHSRVVDIARRLGKRPVGQGRYRFLARIRGNEVFQLEICEKTLQHPRWPAAWNGLSILHLSDLHWEGTIDLPYFREVAHLAQEQHPHLIVFTGDLLDRQELTAWLPDTLGILQAPLGRFFVLGNHDWYLQPEQTRRAMEDLGWHSTAGKTTPIAAQRIEEVLQSEAVFEESASAERRLVIGGDERPWMGTAPDFGPPGENDFRVLLSHTPDNLPCAQSRNVDLMLSGHNHGGQVVLPLVGPVYSPSRYGVKYAAGLFREDPTLLHVSRGVSGRHPLRYHCRPEITLLILHSAAEQSGKRAVSIPGSVHLSEGW